MLRKDLLNEKKYIYYARTYRHLQYSPWKNTLFLCLLVVPSLVMFILYMDDITSFLSILAASILGKIFPGIPLNLSVSEFSFLGVIKFLDLPTVYPNLSFVFINFLVSLAIILFLVTGKRLGNSISIYLLMGFFVHLINCLYFIFSPTYFPYSAFDYSSLYMKQQVGIWITFIVLTAMFVSFMGRLGIITKLITFIGIMLYSFVFGAVRYIVFLYLIEKYSILYMAPMFFVLGPLFDFLYMVSIYGFFIDKMIKLYDSNEGREEWQWS